MKSTRIEETLVEWSDVEDIFSQKLGISCRSGENRSSEIIGKENGFFSSLMLIRPDWIDPDFNLPTELVLKVFTVVKDYLEEEGGDPQNVDRIGRLLQPHNAEVLAYELFSKYGDANLKVPRVFGGRRISTLNYDKPLLVMESLNHLEPGHILKNGSLAEIERVLPSIVALNKITRHLSKEKMEMVRKNMFSERFCLDLYPKEEVERYMRQIGGVKVEGIKEAMVKLDEVVDRITDQSMFAKIDSTSQDLGMEPLMVHGDLWSSNLMWTKENGNPKQGTIIDFQYFALSTPAVDLAAFFASCLSGRDRREKTRELLEKYWQLVADHFEKPLPFTFFQLVASYDRVFPFIAFDVLGILAFVYTTYPHKREKQFALEEKILFLVEDIVEVFKKTHQ